MKGTMTMKKQVTLILTTILLLTSLAGCGEQTTSTSNTVTPTPTHISTPSSTTTQQSASTATMNNKYFSCIVVDGDLAYFDVTIDEFITKYNQIVDNSSKDEVVKEFMKLNTEPELIAVTDDGADIYDVTNPVISTNRSAVGVTLSTLSGSSNIFSVNFDIPNTAGSGTDITESMVLAVMALMGEEANYANSVYNDLRSIGLGYYKGLFMAYYEQPTAKVYRIGACTEEVYNQIK